MTHTKISITFSVFTLQRLSAATTIRKCIQAVLREENITVPCEVNVLVTDDNAIRAINKASRNLDKTTDVLSFPMFELEAGSPPESWDSYIDPETGLCPLGDIVISLERAAAQAQEFGHSRKRELGYLTIHSVLHLLGYDHLDEAEQKVQMREKEEKIAATITGLQRT